MYEQTTLQPSFIVCQADSNQLTTQNHYPRDRNFHPRTGHPVEAVPLDSWIQGEKLRREEISYDTKLPESALNVNKDTRNSLPPKLFKLAISLWN